MRKALCLLFSAVFMADAMTCVECPEQTGDACVAPSQLTEAELALCGNGDSCAFEDYYFDGCAPEEQTPSGLSPPPDGPQWTEMELALFAPPLPDATEEADVGPAVGGGLLAVFNERKDKPFRHKRGSYPRKLPTGEKVGVRKPHAEYAFEHREQATNYSLGRACKAHCKFDRHCGANIAPGVLLRASQRAYGLSVSKSAAVTAEGMPTYVSEKKQKGTQRVWREVAFDL